MNPSDAAKLLAVASSFDQRTIGESDAQAWSAALHGIGFIEARDAVVGHYRTETDRVKPAHIIRRVLAARRAAITSTSALVPPRALADRPRDEQAWKAAAAQAMAAGATEREAMSHACATTGWRYAPGELDAVASPGLGRAIEAIREGMTRGIDDDGPQ